MKFKSFNLPKFIGVALLLSVTSLAAATVQTKQEPADEKEKAKKPPTVEAFAKDKIRHDGFIPFYWDEKSGKVFLEIVRPDEEFLYAHSLATGLGSNPVGLDRGQLGDQKVVRFSRVGPKVLLIQKNLRYRANTENVLEKRAVEQSFAQSILWGGKIAAQSDGKYIVDATDLILADTHDVIGTLKQTEQGDFSLDPKRSAVYLSSCKAFPDNTELEATLTFSSKKPGRYVRQTTPSPKSVSLRQHHSFIKLPDDNYQPRAYDVRSPSLFITFADYASPLDQPLEQRWIMRHRLVKKDLGAKLSEPVEPIVYYVDSGAPKQIQEALVEGASWWNDAFEAAGFKNAFQVKLLPPDADPLDVRYNVIQWVHRSTRGWSYGGSVIDPRTGEIIKGHVSLGSLRVRQDQLLVNSLASPAPHLRCACCGIGGIAEESTLADMASPINTHRDPTNPTIANPETVNNALEVSLARIRQLSAHEVGHTIGFVHNFAASTYADRASVMDYPAPRVKISADGTLDISDAYGVGIGEWDKVSVKFAYTQFNKDESEAEKLNEILDSAAKAKMIFISDSDARAAGAAHPLANLWDNGSDPLEELQHVMRVRRIGLDRFDPAKLPQGTTTADIAQYLTPLYLHHRYQLQAAGKLLGGQVYQYGYANQEQQNQPVPNSIQESAINVLIKTISPAELMIEQEVLRAISPRPYSTIRDAEILPTQSGRIFDPLAAAKIAANLTLDELLHPHRLNRLAQQSIDGAPSPRFLINRIYFHAWKTYPKEQAQSVAIAAVVKEAVAEHLIELVDNTAVDSSVRTAAYNALRAIYTAEGASTNGIPNSHLARKIELFLQRPFTVLPGEKNLNVPPGSPIGATR